VRGTEEAIPSGSISSWIFARATEATVPTKTDPCASKMRARLPQLGHG
jgi:hypothetical protein